MKEDEGLEAGSFKFLKKPYKFKGNPTRGLATKAWRSGQAKVVVDRGWSIISEVQGLGRTSSNQKEQERQWSPKGSPPTTTKETLEGHPPLT